MRFVFACLILFATVFAKDVKKSDEWKFNGRVNVYLQNIDVFGKDTANRDGFTDNEEVSLNFKGGLFNGKSGVDIRFRHTNDSRVQDDETELLYFRSYYRDKKWMLEAGDVAISLNPYVYSSSLKGAKISYKSDKKENTFRYLFAGGIISKGWRDIYKDYDNEQATAYSGAGEIKYIYKRAKEISFSAACYKDDLSTQGKNSNKLGKEGYSLGLDTKWRFNKYVTLKARGAITSATQDIKNNAPKKTRDAIYVKFLTRPILKSLKSDFTYKRIDPNYVSLGGSASSDIEQFENTTRWRINKEYSAKLDLKASRNNLDNNDSTTLRTHYEALELMYRPKKLRRSSFMARLSNKHKESANVDTYKKSAKINMRIRTKNGWRYGFGYEFVDYADRIDTNNSKVTNIISSLVGYKKKLSKESSYRFTCRLNYRNIRHAQDTVGLKIDAGYIHNKRLSADLSYILNDTNHDLQNDTTNNTYQLRGTYKLDSSGRNVVRVLLEKRDVDVENNSKSSYDEYIQKISLVMNF